MIRGKRNYWKCLVNQETVPLIFIRYVYYWKHNCTRIISFIKFFKRYSGFQGRVRVSNTNYQRFIPKQEYSTFLVFFIQYFFAELWRFKFTASVKIYEYCVEAKRTSREQYEYFEFNFARKRRHSRK